MKKILGIVSSTRKLGNSEILVKEIMGSVPGECTRELIRLTDLKIEPCRACYRCLQPDTECQIKDDFNYILGKIKEADAVIFGVPVYLLGPHGYYKMLIDRMVGNENHSRFTEGKPFVTVIPFGQKRWEGYARAATLVLPRLLKMKLVDTWLVHATLPGEAFIDPDNLEHARKLGRELFTREAKAPAARECGFCGSDIFRLLPDNRVECPICGAIGVLKPGNLPDVSGSDYTRYDPLEMEEHFKVWLVEMKQKFLAEKDSLKEIQKGYQEPAWWVKP
ncbi:MAG: flavodoxin family protein [Firmicutes bacterium]|nr:flavodoxin family protein [Bacillota bacterium]